MKSLRSGIVCVSILVIIVSGAFAGNEPELIIRDIIMTAVEDN